MPGRASVLPSYIPTKNHSTEPLTEKQVASRITSYLNRAKRQPVWNPDSILQPGGVNFCPTSVWGQNWAIYHMGRIRDGLEGIEWAPDPKELMALEAMVPHRDRAADGEEVMVLDGDVLRPRLKVGRGLEGLGNSRERVVKARPSLKKGSSLSSELDGTELERTRRWELNGGLGDAGLERIVERSSPPQSSPLHYMSGAIATEEKGEVAQWIEGVSNDSGEEDWQDAQEYAETRDVIEGEVGDRDGAPVVRQGGEAGEPAVRATDEEGNLRNEIASPSRKRRAEGPGDSMPTKHGPRRGDKRAKV